jgi:hypothetical protein
MAGETKVWAVTGAPQPTSNSYGQVCVAHNKVEFLSTDTQSNDINTMLYIPANSLVHGVALKTDDLDSGSEALVWSVLLGTTAYTAGTTVATSLAGFFGVGEPILTTGVTAVNLKSTGAAATGAAGTVSISVFYTTLD